MIDKYLELTRLFLFAAGGEAKMYISSADWMSRNLKRRIEVACPIYGESIKAELKEQLFIQLRDNSKARILDPQLINQYADGNTENKYRAQEDFYKDIKAINTVSEETTNTTE